jgi:hypothetical protein
MGDLLCFPSSAGTGEQQTIQDVCDEAIYLLDVVSDRRASLEDRLEASKAALARVGMVSKAIHDALFSGGK